MTVALEITELSDLAKCIEYINGVEGHITVKMVSKHCNVKAKMAKYALRNHSNTMICNPFEYGSIKYKNYNLFKKISDEDKQIFCEHERSKLKQYKYLNNGANYFFKKYRITAIKHG